MQKNVYKWRKLKTAANVPISECPIKFNVKKDCKMLKESANSKPKNVNHPQQISANAAMRVQACTIRMRLSKFNFHQKCGRKKAYLSMNKKTRRSD